MSSRGAAPSLDYTVATQCVDNGCTMTKAQIPLVRIVVELLYSQLLVVDYTTSSGCRLQQIHNKSKSGV